MNSISETETLSGRVASSWQSDIVALSVAKWVVLCVVLVMELLALTIRFDTASLIQANGWLAFFRDYISIVPQLMAVALAASLIFGGKQIADAMSGLCQADANYRAWPLWLALQIFLYFLLYRVTAHLFEVERGASVVWTICWLALGLCCGFAWLAAMIRPANHGRLTAGLTSVVLAATAMGGLAWCAGQYATQYWSGLAGVTFQCVDFLLSCCGLEVSQDVSELTLGTPEFLVQIAPACSGVEGMGLSVVFVSSYLWWCRRDHYFPRALLLLPMAIVLMFAANCARITLLIMLGHFGWPDIALGGFHSQAGWLAFNFVALGVVAGARVSPFFSNHPLPLAETPQSKAIPLLAPFVILMLTVILSDVVQTSFDWLYPLRFFVVIAVILWLTRMYPPQVWVWTRNWVGPICGLLVYVIWIFLEPPASFTTNVELYAETRTQAPVWFAVWCLLRVLGSVITVPLAEEFAFRGYLIPWLTSSKTQQRRASHHWPWSAILISSMAFGALHPGRWLAATAAGCIYAYAFCRRGFLMDAILAHATTNALIAGQVLLFNHWGLWG